MIPPKPGRSMSALCLYCQRCTDDGHRTDCNASTDWVANWQMPEMYAGVPGLSAEDAAYATGIEIEDLNNRGLPYSGTVADIFKCFDQIVRPLVEALLIRAGFPKRVLAPYMHMLNNLIVHNLFAGHIGLGHKHPCGLPQGCPFSMMCHSPATSPMALQDARHLHQAPHTRRRHPVNRHWARPPAEDCSCHRSNPHIHHLT